MWKETILFSGSSGWTIWISGYDTSQALGKEKANQFILSIHFTLKVIWFITSMVKWKSKAKTYCKLNRVFNTTLEL